MATQEKSKIEILLESDKFKGIASLYSWSYNYDARTGTPFGVFLDLIGYSRDEFGENLVSDPSQVLGYLELDYLADALREYADSGSDAYDFASSLISAEMENN